MPVFAIDIIIYVTKLSWFRFVYTRPLSLHDSKLPMFVILATGIEISITLIVLCD